MIFSVGRGLQDNRLDFGGDPDDKPDTGTLQVFVFIIAIPVNSQEWNMKILIEGLNSECFLVIIVIMMMIIIIILFLNALLCKGTRGFKSKKKIFREGVEWPWDDLIQFWVNSGKRVAPKTPKTPK